MAENTNTMDTAQASTNKASESASYNTSAAAMANAFDNVTHAATSPDSAAEIERLKAAITKANKENAELNRKLRTKQTDEENAAADQQARWDEMESQLAERDKRIAELEKNQERSDARANFLTLPGVDESIANDLSSALVDGDRKKLFDGLKKAFEAHEKSLKQQAYKNMPGPDGAGGGEKRADVDLGKSFGKARADAMKGSNETLKKYQL